MIMKTVSVDVKDLKKVIPTLHAYDKVLLSGLFILPEMPRISGS